MIGTTVHCFDSHILTDMVWVVEGKIIQKNCYKLVGGSSYCGFVLLRAKIIVNVYNRNPGEINFGSIVLMNHFYSQLYPPCWLPDSKYHARPCSKLGSHSAELSRGTIAAHTQPFTNPGNNWRDRVWKREIWGRGCGAKGIFCTVTHQCRTSYSLRSWTEQFS